MSRDCAIALHPGSQEQNSVSKQTNKQKKKTVKHQNLVIKQHNLESDSKEKIPPLYLTSLVILGSDVVSLCLSFLIYLSKPEHFRVK